MCLLKKCSVLRYSLCFTIRCCLGSLGKNQTKADRVLEMVSHFCHVWTSLVQLLHCLFFYSAFCKFGCSTIHTWDIDHNDRHAVTSQPLFSHHIGPTLHYSHSNCLKPCGSGLSSLDHQGLNQQVSALLGSRVQPLQTAQVWDAIMTSKYVSLACCFLSPTLHSFIFQPAWLHVQQLLCVSHSCLPQHSRSCQNFMGRPWPISLSYIDSTNMWELFLHLRTSETDRFGVGQMLRAGSLWNMALACLWLSQTFFYHDQP